MTKRTREDARDRLLCAIADAIIDLLDNPRPPRERNRAVAQNIRGFQSELLEAAPQVRGQPASIRGGC